MQDISKDMKEKLASINETLSGGIKVEGVAYDPDDPMHISVDNIRSAVLAAYRPATANTMFNELPDELKVSAILSGTMLALLSVVMSAIKPGKESDAIEAIQKYIPIAAASVRDVVDQYRMDAAAKKARA